MTFLTVAGSHLLSIHSRLRRVTIIAASVVLYFFLIMNHRILSSNELSSQSPTTKKMKAKSSFRELESCGGALASDIEKSYHGNNNNSMVINLTALEWITKSQLGCEFSYVGGREHALELLRNKHILFIGDSVLRYQFRSLLYSLHFGYTNIKGPGNRTHPSEVWRGDFRSFNRFLQQIQIDLTEEYFQCDCFRRHNTMMGMYENMYYFDPEYNFNLTFFIHMDSISGGHRPLRRKPEFNKSELDLYVSQGNKATAPIVAPDFLNISVHDLVNMFLKDVGTVDELVVSLGDHHRMDNVGKKGSRWTWEEYSRPLEQLVKAPNTPTYALSTRTWRRAPLTTLALEDNWKLFNRTAIIEPLVELFQKQEWPMNLLYTDDPPLHFWGWAYDRLNAELLQVLLPQPS